MKYIHDKFLLPITALLLLVGTTLIFINVVLRKVFHNPWGGTEELSSILLMTVVYLPLAFIELNNKQLTMSVFFDLFPKKFQMWIRKIEEVIILIIFIYLTYGAYILVAKHFVEKNTTLIIGLPLYVLYLIMLISFALTVLTKGYQLFISLDKGDSHD